MAGDQRQQPEQSISTGRDQSGDHKRRRNGLGRSEATTPEIITAATQEECREEVLPRCGGFPSAPSPTFATCGTTFPTSRSVTDSAEPQSARRTPRAAHREEPETAAGMGGGSLSWFVVDDAVERPAPRDDRVCAGGKDLGMAIDGSGGRLGKLERESRVHHAGALASVVHATVDPVHVLNSAAHGSGQDTWQRCERRVT